MEYFFPAKELVVNASGSRRSEAQLCETFVVKQSGWGYTRLSVEAEGGFLSLEKKVLTEEDFLGTMCIRDRYQSFLSKTAPQMGRAVSLRLTACIIIIIQ